MFTGKIIAIALAILIALGVGAGFIIKLQNDDAAYRAQRAADIAAMKDAGKRPAIIPQSPATWGR